jgi:autotransporter-associated beta strand protein
VGVTNNSGIVQTFVTREETSGDGEIDFTNSANAGNLTSFVINGSTPTIPYHGSLLFSNTASAGNASIVLEGSSFNGFPGGALFFFDSASVGRAQIIANGGLVSGASGGSIAYYGLTPGTGTGSITINGGAVAGALGAGMFCLSFDAGNNIYTVNGGNGAGATGGMLSFESTDGANGTLIANGGTNGGTGGAIYVFSNNSARAPRVRVFGNGTFDMSGWTSTGDTVTSLKGDGVVLLGGNRLTVDRDLSIVFGGVIADGGLYGGAGGSLTKTGSADLTLRGANTYTGGTVLDQGALMVDNTSGSGTGTGPVQVNAGILGGQGTIAGAVTVGTANGFPTTLEPSSGRFTPTTFTIQGSVTFAATAEFAYSVKSKIGQADLVIANGVTIKSGAIFQVLSQPQKKLPAGKVITAIKNTSATAISGTFSNAADGSIVNVGRNNCQVSYEGGDGNDLTLTVVP